MDEYVVWNGPGWPCHEFMGKDSKGRLRWTDLEDATRFTDKEEAEACFPYGYTTVLTYEQAKQMLKTGIEPVLPQRHWCGQIVTA